MNSDQATHWRRTRSLMWVTLAIWFVFSFVVHWFCRCAERGVLPRISAWLLHGRAGFVDHIRGADLLVRANPGSDRPRMRHGRRRLRRGRPWQCKGASSTTCPRSTACTRAGSSSLSASWPSWSRWGWLPTPSASCSSRSPSSSTPRSGGCRARCRSMPTTSPGVTFHRCSTAWRRRRTGCPARRSWRWPAASTWAATPTLRLSSAGPAGTCWWRPSWRLTCASSAATPCPTSSARGMAATLHVSAPCSCWWLRRSPT